MVGHLPGLNAYNFNSAKEDKNLSAIMTSIFAKTKINVYIYEFSEIAVFTIKGPPVVKEKATTASDVAKKVIGDGFVNMTNFWRCIKQYFEHPEDYEAIADENGIIHTDMAEATLYLSNKSIEIFTIDEIKGLLVQSLIAESASARNFFLPIFSTFTYLTTVPVLKVIGVTPPAPMSGLSKEQQKVADSVNYPHLR